MKVGKVLEEMEMRCISMVDSVAMTMGQLLEEVKSKIKNIAEGIPDTLEVPMPGQVTYVVVVGKTTQRAQIRQFGLQPRLLQQAVLLHEDAKAKQVLVKLVRGGRGVTEMSEEALVLKATLTVKAIQKEGERKITMVGAKKAEKWGNNTQNED